ncbi:MAG: hypothetical protein SH847_05760 [Roseiflexaceae bacterium]|nr:hypothetical protein [Roseiflexaceae bacterium]
MSIIPGIPDQNRLSTWMSQLNTWLDCHPVTLEEADIVHQADLPVLPVEDRALNDAALELDWLRLATRVSSECERRTCLQNALRINPKNELARRELARHSGHLVV